MENDLKMEKWAVLIVEDDPMLRMDATDMVEDAGFVAYAARDADEAITFLETRRDIRILFTDVHMNGSMDGLKLAHAVRDRWPPVAIFVTSGVANVTASDMPENGLFFSKPYPPQALIKAMTDILAKITGEIPSPAIVDAEG
jgi:CheY-like chemotaxis protein